MKKIIKKVIMYGSRWGKTDVLRNLISNKPDFNKIYLYVRDTYEGKKSIVNWNYASVLIDYFNHLEAFIYYPRDVDSNFNNVD